MMTPSYYLSLALAVSEERRTRRNKHNAQLMLPYHYSHLCFLLAAVCIIIAAKTDEAQTEKAIGYQKDDVEY